MKDWHQRGLEGGAPYIDGALSCKLSPPGKEPLEFAVTMERRSCATVSHRLRHDTCAVVSVTTICGVVRHRRFIRNMCDWSESVHT